MRRFGLSDEDLRQLGYKIGGRPGGEAEPPAETGPGKPGKPRVRRRASPALRIWAATLVLLPVVAWLSSLGRGLPQPAPAAAPDSTFSSARALAQLVEVSQQAHPTGSPDLERVRNVIVGRLSTLGLEPDVQVTTAFRRERGFVRAATVRNVVARVPGSSSSGAVALIAHYDAAPLSPGAGDNGIGVATLLETVRAVAAGEPLRDDLIVVFSDAGELGHLGAEAFAEEHPWASDVALTVFVDSRGSSGPVFLFESVSENGAIVADLAAAGTPPRVGSLAGALRGDALEDGLSDAATTPALAYGALKGMAWEDQRRDSRDRVSERTLQHGGQQLLALVRALGRRDLPSELTAPERVYLSLPVVGLVHYRRSGVLLTSLGLLVLWGLLGWVIKLRRATRNGVLIGLAAGVGAVGLSSLAARALFGAISGLHPEYGSLRTAFYRDGPHVLALALLALALTSVVYALARRWSRVDEVLFGALALPLALAIWSTFAAPAAAPSIQWPLSVALVGAWVVTVLGPTRGSSVWAWGVVLGLSAVTLALVVPDLELVAQAETLRRAGTLGALFALAGIALLPLMDWLQRPKAWATPLLALLAGGAAIGLDLPAVQGAVDHPEPTTLVYLTDEASPGPVMRGPPPVQDTTRARTVLGKWLTVRGPGEEWARSWVGDPPTGSTDAGVLLIGPDSLYEVAGTAPDARLAPPRVTLLLSELAGGRRNVTLGVDSQLGGEMLGFHVPDGIVAELTGVGNATWEGGSDPIRSLVHWGVPEGGTLTLRMSLAEGATETELVVLEHHLRPQDVLGAYFFQRADSLIANAATGSDRVIQRTRLRFGVIGPALPPASDGS